MGFTVEDRYWPLPTLTTLKVLYLAKKEIHRLAVAQVTSYKRLQSLGLSSKICSCSACWSVADVNYLEM